MRFLNILRFLFRYMVVAWGALISCIVRKTGPIFPLLVGLIAGRLANKQNRVNFEFLFSSCIAKADYIYFKVSFEI